MKKLSLSFILIFALAGCGTQVADKQVDTEGESVETRRGASVQQGDVVDSEKTVEAETKDAVSKEEVKATISDNISLTSIKADDLLVSPALIEGEANIESGFVMIELRKKDQSLTSESVETAVRDGKFSIPKFWFEFSNTNEGFVAVYDRDNKENIVEIPVRFQTVK